MVKTQIQLEKWQYAKLKQAGITQAKSLSELVRVAVSELLEKIERRPTQRLEEVAGKYVGGGLSDLKDHDRAWVESVR